jgi:ribosomal protein S18 acetylase RimI-like enzyme
MSPEYRNAVPGDAADCINLRSRTRENGVSRDRLRELGITVESWGRDIESGRLPGFINQAEGQMQGYCFGDTQTGEIVVLALLPKAEGRGIGRNLLSLTVRMLRDAGHKRLHLGCSSDSSVRSFGFYRHLGWKSTGQVDSHGDEILELI